MIKTDYKTILIINDDVLKFLEAEENKITQRKTQADDDVLG